MGLQWVKKSAPLSKDLTKGSFGHKSNLLLISKKPKIKKKYMLLR